MTYTASFSRNTNSSAWANPQSISNGPSDTPKRESIYITADTGRQLSAPPLTRTVPQKCTPYLDGVHMDLPTDTEESRNDIAEIFGKVIGQIHYIVDSTRPDIVFAATALSLPLKKPTQRHWNHAQRLTQYLHTTRSEVILMPFNISKHVQIKAYSDADYANNQTSQKSISGMLKTVNSAPVQWLAWQQPVVAKRTCEAEYIAAAEATIKPNMAPELHQGNATTDHEAHHARRQHSRRANGKEHGRDQTTPMHRDPLLLLARHRARRTNEDRTHTNYSTVSCTGVAVYSPRAELTC